MCKSAAAGGQRCPSHALERLAGAQTRKAQVEAAFAAGNATSEKVAAARAANWKALVEYASTNAGSAKLRGQYAEIPDPTSPAAGLLRSAIDEGALLAQANRRTENAYRANLGKGPLSTPTPNTMAQQESIDAAARASAAEEAAPGVGASQPRQRALPTARPAPSASRRPAQRPSAGEQNARAQQMAARQSERDAARQAEREARAAERVLAREQRTEATRLKKEVAAEVKATRDMVERVWTVQPTAPAGTWSGPSRWAEGSTVSRRVRRRENHEALREGKARYGKVFDQAMDEFGTTFSARDVLEACDRLEAQGHERVSGVVRPEGWYEGFRHVQPAWVQSARAQAFAETFGPNQRAVIARQYAQVNLRQVLGAAHAARPRRAWGRVWLSRSQGFLERTRMVRRAAA